MTKQLPQTLIGLRFCYVQKEGESLINELYHYGIKGMKWGVRRFQNPDGSYTAAGRARYNVGGYKGTSQKKKNSNRPAKMQSVKTAADSTHNALGRVKERVNRPKTHSNKSLDLSRMSDQELRDRVNRGNLERQYAQLYGTQQVSKGRQRVASVLDALDDVVVVAGSAASISLMLYSIKAKTG